MELLRYRDVTLEICPTSNWLTNAVESPAAHPLKSLDRKGVPVTINSDDPALFGIDLNHEYRIMADAHGLDEADFHRLNERALKASFIPDAEKHRAFAGGQA